MNTNHKQIAFFEKYLSLWVLLCIILGVFLGNYVPSVSAYLGRFEIAKVNIPVAILIWLMIYPMMLQIDFSKLKDIRSSPKGLILTIIVNWLVKPFTMAFFAWLFFSQLYSVYINPELASEYIAGAILLGAAPCTAMVFVWSYLSDGDPNYTLVQVAINDLIILFAFVPIVSFLLGITDIQVPYSTLTLSVFIFVVIPLLAGILTQKYLRSTKGIDWMLKEFLPKLKHASIVSLLLTLILLFAFQGDNLTKQPIIILLIAIPLIVQTYLIFFLTWFVGKKVKLPYQVCAPSSMIAASNFFELAVAVAISLFGLSSPAALVTVVGVLVEVPVMLSLVYFANKFRFH